MILLELLKGIKQKVNEIFETTKIFLNLIKLIDNNFS